MLRVGLAGLGVHGIRYARHLLRGEVEGARLTVVCRADPEAGRAFAREHGLDFAGSPAELAEHPAVDAVLLVLPPHHHPSAARACLARGRPVLVEKPLAPTAAAAREVVRAAERGGAIGMIAQTLRFDPLVERLREEAAAVGPLRQIAINQRFAPSLRPWIDTPGSGGMLLNTAVHGFDLMRHLSGLEPVRISAEVTARGTRRTEDQAVALVRLEPGPVLASLDNARTTAARSGRIEIVGENAQLWGDHIHRTLCRVTERTVRELGPIPPQPTIPLTLRAFVRSIERGSTPPVTLADGLRAVEMVEAAARSAHEGRSVRIEEVR